MPFRCPWRYISPFCARLYIQYYSKPRPRKGDLLAAQNLAAPAPAPPRAAIVPAGRGDIAIVSRVAPYDVRRAMVVKCQAHGTPCSGASVGGSGVINTSFRRPRAQLWPSQFPSRAPGVTPNAREFHRSSALQSGRLGVPITAREGLILPSRVDACWHSHTKKAGTLFGRPYRAGRPSRLPHARYRPLC